MTFLNSKDKLPNSKCKIILTIFNLHFAFFIELGCEVGNP